jgi:hypothetical protein
MATFAFIFFTMAGLLLTGFCLAYYRKRANLTGHQYGIIAAIGISLTWLLSFFTPILVTEHQIRDTGIAVLGLGLSLSAGFVAYVAVRFLFLLKKKK